MELIKLFFLGVMGYLMAGWYDLAIMYNKPLLKKVLYVGFFITPVPYLVIFFTWSSPLSVVARVVVILLMVLFAVLLFYSVLLEIPLKAEKTGKLYRKGTYSLSRHPGFIWFTMINFLISVYFWNYQITLLSIGFTACNLILITLEDLVLFPRMFPEYKEYRKETPFFISM
jgi:protein-S-isoprenylcysteine O-methyltransferase Ste14